MPRDIPLGNGSLLVNFDQAYQLRDLYWPYVGQENHTGGHPFRFGLWVDGRFSWLSDPLWSRSITYQHDTIVTQVTLYNAALSLRLVCRDAVDFHENLYVREVSIENQAEDAREVRLFFGQDFHISGTSVGDSAYYEPERRAVFHYKGPRWFMVNAAKAEGEGLTIGLDAWAVGVKEAQGKEGTWRDAEDGSLSGSAVAQGSVDSVVALHFTVPGRGTTTGWYWIAVGADFAEVTRINRAVRSKGPEAFLIRTRDYWRLWVSKEQRTLSGLPPSVRHLYRRSLLILRTQIDNRGAILAANDFDITSFARDTYSYMWPRDGALVASSLIDAGYSVVTRGFFDFCHRVITDEGYLLHKYNPDGTLASSWHGWHHSRGKQLPIQEDETALVLWSLWRHFDRFRDVEFIKPHYRGLIVRAANWMVSYRDPDTGLPLPSWDLWEERRGIHSWTVGAVWGGLDAAARFSQAFGEHELASSYRRAAQEVKSAAEAHLWDQDRAYFRRTLEPKDDGSWAPDSTIDASLMGLWYFGMFDAEDPRVSATMLAIRDRLWVKTDVGGLARYENDTYHQVSNDLVAVPGNPWFVCTLWLAQWYIAKAHSADDLAPAMEILDWVASRALPSGVLAEQVNPYTNKPISVSPLTWSHATLVKTVQEYAARSEELAERVAEA